MAASTVKLSGGTTTIRIAGSAAKALRSAGVTMSPSKPAQATGAGILLPVSGGSIDPATAKGTISQKGGLVLKKGRTKLSLGNLVLNTSKGTLSAKSGKTSVAIASLSGGKVARRGFATTVSGVKVKLNKTGAGALNTSFATRAFKAGLVLATASSAPTSKQVAIARGTTSIHIDPTAARTLIGAGASVGAIAPATLDTTTLTLSLPITGGVLNPDTLDGQITHGGGLSIGSFQLTSVALNLGSTKTLSTSLGTLADLQYSTMATNIDAAKRTIAIGDISINLNSTAIAALGAISPSLAALPAGTPIGAADVAAAAR
ncbi:MAG TPA: hypothetical protein VGM91_22570 [Conexibacter sp.]